MPGEKELSNKSSLASAMALDDGVTWHIARVYIQLYPHVGTDTYFS